MPDDPAAIVFFDGVCGLCDRVVAVLARADRGRRLRFAPLQGATAAARLPPAEAAPESLVVLAGGVAYRQSAAVLAILDRLGGPWRVLAVALRLVPGAVRDAAYRWVAGRRYRWFGQLRACRLPAPGERSVFLD